MTTRKCASCQLCCYLLPVAEIKKERSAKCVHQRYETGCRIYETRPDACRAWSCRWLTHDGTNGMPRPDKCHFVIDPVPDFITATDPDSGNSFDAPVVQIWADPHFPETHNDPRLRKYLVKEATKNGVVGLIRYGTHAFVLVPPAHTATGEWLVVEGVPGPDHSMEEIANVIAGVNCK